MTLLRKTSKRSLEYPLSRVKFIYNTGNIYPTLVTKSQFYDMANSQIQKAQQYLDRLILFASNKAKLQKLAFRLRIFPQVYTLRWDYRIQMAMVTSIKVSTVLKNPGGISLMSNG
jgi:hypothetical protein